MIKEKRKQSITLLGGNHKVRINYEKNGLKQEYLENICE